MNIEEVREYCLLKKGVSESFPFGENVLVFKVLNKIFALTDLDNPNSLNLKCDPQEALLLREKFPEIQPGFHMNKKHWNTIILTGGLENKLLLRLIDHSYDQVIKSFTRNDRQILENL